MSVSRLVGWLVGWLAGWSVGWLVGRLVSRYVIIFYKGWKFHFRAPVTCFFILHSACNVLRIFTGDTAALEFLLRMARQDE